MGGSRLPAQRGVRNLSPGGTRSWTATGGWCTIPAVILATRKWVTKLLPSLVILWLAFVVVGGAVLLPQHSGLDADRADKAGLGLCAATAAAVFAAVARRPRRPACSSWRSCQTPPSCPDHTVGRTVPLPPAVPLRQTLQVFLN